MFKLLLIAIMYNIKSQFAKPFEFFLIFLSTLLNNCIYLYGIYAIIYLSDPKHPNKINVLLISTSLVITSWGIINTLYGGLIELGKLIENGKLEPFIATPYHPLFLVAISKSEISGLAELIQGLVVIIILGYTINFAFSLKLLIGAVVTALALLGVIILGGTLSFFVERGNSLSSIFIQTIFSMSLFPVITFFNNDEKLFLYFTPILVTSYLPLHYIYNANIYSFLFAFFGSSVLIMFSLCLFNIGLKYNKSANVIKLMK